MYLCKGYNGRLEELTGLFSPSCILLDASLSDDRTSSSGRNVRDCICILSLCLKKVLCGFALSTKNYRTFATRKEYGMLTKVIEQAKIDPLYQVV